MTCVWAGFSRPDRLKPVPHLEAKWHNENS